MANKAGMSSGIEVARISVKVSPDTKNFRRELQAELDAIEKSLKLKVKVGADVDTAAAEAKLNNAARKRDAKIKVDVKSGDTDLKTLVDESRLKSSLGRVKDEWAGFLKGLRGQAGAVEIPVEVKETENSKKNRRKKGGISNPDVPDFPDIPSVPKGFPSFGTGINPAGWAVILAAITAAAGPLVGLISTSLAAIPGLISLIAAPIAAVTLGLQGFKDAAATIKPQFEALKQTMSDAAKSSFTPVMQQIADSILPKLASSLPSVTKGLADMASGVLDGLDDNRLTVAINRIGTAFSAMKPGIEGFTSGFVGLIDQFTAKLPGVANWINEAGAGFDKWVSKVSADGSLQAAFGNLGTVLKEIAGTVADLGKKGIEFLSDPGKVEGTLSVIRNVKDILDDIMTISGKIADNWNKIFGGALPDISPEGGLSDKKILEPITGKDAPWRSMMPWLSEKFPAPDGVQQQVDALGKSIEQTGAKAEAVQPKVNNLLNGTNVQGPGLNGDMPGASPAAPVEPPKVEPPNTEEAKAKLEEYNTFVKQVTDDVKTAMQQGTQGGSIPPPDLSAFKAAWNELPGVVSNALSAAVTAAVGGIQGIVEAFIGGSQAILAVVTSWPPMIQAALSSMSTIGVEAGTNLATGMVAGINSGIGWVTAAATNLAIAAKNAAKAALDSNSPSKVFIKIGEDTSKGFAIGLENGIEPVVAQAKDLAGKIADVFSKGGDPTALLDGFGKKEVTRMEKVLAFESKRLGIQAKALDYQAKTTGNQALKAQADAIRGKKEELDLQKEMMDLTKEYADLNAPDKLEGTPFGDALQSMMGMPMDFAKSTGQQFMQDIGMSGGGALGALTDYATGFATKYVFNVSNVDEAMAIHSNQVAKQSAGIVGR